MAPRPWLGKTVVVQVAPHFEPHLTTFIFVVVFPSSFRRLSVRPSSFRRRSIVVPSSFRCRSVVVPSSSRRLPVVFPSSFRASFVSASSFLQTTRPVAPPSAGPFVRPVVGPSSPPTTLTLGLLGGASKLNEKPTTQQKSNQ